MPVNLVVPDACELFPVRGARLGVASAGIKKAGRDDVTVILLDEGANVAGVFTQNRYCAAPVQVCQMHIQRSPSVRALLINTGCANAGTGEAGLNDAKRTCLEVANRLGIKDVEVLPFSTGVIMEPLPMGKLVNALDAAIADAKDDHWLRAAKAIMTTDTLPKVCSRQIQLGGETVTISGMSKGAGMIHPNMATMLSFIATDANIAPSLMSTLVKELADASFNRVTVDGDESTNDSFMLMATNQAGSEIKDWTTSEAALLKKHLTEVAQELSIAIVRDGEGATKLITIRVEQGKTHEECLKVAFAVAHSPLVKTAFFASDPNLGRILCAVGYAGIADLDQTKIELYLNDLHVVTKGGRASTYREADGQRVMKESEILVRVQLGRGQAEETVWTCDLSHDYVSINADYRS